MPRKKYAPEEIVAKLRQVDVLISLGQNIADAIRQIGVSEVTYYRWRREYRGLKTEHVKHLQELETENTRLRKAVSGLTLDKLTNVPSLVKTRRDADIRGCQFPTRNRPKRSARAQLDDLLAHGSGKMRPRRIDLAFYLARENQELAKIERTAIILMSHIYQRKHKSNKLITLIPTQDRKAFVTNIAPALDHKSACYRIRALVLTYCMIGIPIPLIAHFLVKSRYKIQRLIQRYCSGEIVALLTRPSKVIKKSERKDLRDRLFAIMHAPPMDYDINRTTWTIKLLKNILLKEGTHVGANTLSAIIRAEGYHFRKTRAVLTSTDPNYREKMKRITRILRRLGPDDRFFSVDEYGPFSVRQHGGRRRVRRGEYPTIPQYQQSLGYLIATAALELSTNQVTHFFSKKKDTEEMITLMRRLIEQYSGCRRVYFSWDAASWHSSKKFLAEVRRVNKPEYRNANQTPMVKLAPLPCRAQFLNVIESVFNGMSIAIIHNSDYESVDAAKAAIDRYFGERNSYFKQNPKRAGNKIWGGELVPSKFSESNNCKNPKLMNLSNVR
jgi:transposase